jgi:hypothetical protein
MAPADSLCAVTKGQAHGFRGPFGRELPASKLIAPIMPADGSSRRQGG